MKALHKREPILIIAVLVAVLNLVVGKDTGLDVQTIASVVVPLLGGVVGRKVVTPVDTSDGSTVPDGE